MPDEEKAPLDRLGRLAGSVLRKFLMPFTASAG